MNLEVAIDLYVQRKQATGLSFTTAHKTYRSFLRTVGNLPLSEIDVDHVLRFLNPSETSLSSFRKKHSLIRHFLEYWSAHGMIAGVPVPANLPRRRPHFLPYIYTKEELRRLLQLAPLVKTANDKIHHKTVRAVLLVLYATGAMVGEITKLVNEDLDLEHGFLSLSGGSLKVGRSIPIGRDLVRLMGRYENWRKRMGPQSKLFFSRIDGGEISSRALGAYFRRLRHKAGIAGHLATGQRPCVRDLRATFAVHRITSWIRSKEDLNRMLPALGAYMGNAGVESTERYLQLTPERFQNALNKLSPPCAHVRWQNDLSLLDFLANF